MKRSTTRGKAVTAVHITRVFDAYEVKVFNPALAWVREGRLPPELGDGYLGDDLDRALDELHGLRSLIRQDADRENGASASYGALS